MDLRNIYFLKLFNNDIDIAGSFIANALFYDYM